MATTYALPAIADQVAARVPPRPLVLRTVAIAGLLTAAGSLALALTSDGVSGIQVALLEWISIPYIAAGLVAWWRRPDSRLGVLMIVGGFATGISGLAFAQFALPHTIGVIFDVLPAVIFLHVYLAFPEGRLRSHFERGLIAAGYAAAIGFQLVKMSLGGVGPKNLIEVSARTAAAHTVEQVQLVSISALCLAGIAVLAARRRQAGRPLRRPVALLIDSFALGLVMIAVLFAFGAFNGPAFQTIQRATLIVIGISPIAFLVGLLDARLARAAVGNLIVVLTHRPHDVVVKGETTFTFVTDGIESAIAQARAAAGDKKVHVMGGASVIQQALQAGLVDSLHLHVAPVVLGAGTRLFDNLTKPIELERTEVVESQFGTHLRFRVLK